VAEIITPHCQSYHRADKKSFLKTFLAPAEPLAVSTQIDNYKFRHFFKYIIFICPLTDTYIVFLKK
jgi:hypothetical protein